MSSESSSLSSLPLESLSRLADAAEKIAEALSDLATINRERLGYEFPQRKPEDATISKFKSPNPIARDVAESFPEDLWIGTREKKWITRQERKQRKAQVGP